MGAECRTPSDGEHQLQDNEDLVVSDSRLVDEDNPLCEEDNLETMTKRLCPYGYEIFEDPLAASGAGPTQPPLDETLSDLMGQLGIQDELEALDWKQLAAKQQNFVIGILNWALNLIDISQSLQRILHDVLARFATSQDLVLALQREREEVADVRASLETRLRENGSLLKKAEDRVATLEKENQETATLFATVKRQVEYLNRFLNDEQWDLALLVGHRINTALG